LLRTAPWAFARAQASLTLIGQLNNTGTTEGPGVFPFLFQYSYPADCLKFRYVVPPPPPNYAVTVSTGQPLVYGPWLRPSRNNRFLLSNDVDVNGNQTKSIITNVCEALGVYTREVTNPDVFDDLFEGALQAALSYRLVMPLTGNVGMRDEFKQAAEQAIAVARAADGNEAIGSTDHTPDWIKTRGVGYYSGYGAPVSGWGEMCCSWENMSWGE